MKAADASGPRRTKLSRRLIRLAVASTFLLGLGMLGTLVLVRDPEPYFRARKGVIAEVEADAPIEVVDHTERLVAVRSTTGLVVRFAIKEPLPAHAPGDPLRPLILVLGGHKTGLKALRYIGPTSGAIVAALSYPYDGPEKPKGLDFIRAVPLIRRAFLDTAPAVQLSLDYLIALPGVDPSRVELCGVSLGGPFACIAGALEPRFTRVWSIHGAGDPYALLKVSIGKYIPWSPLCSVAAGAAYVAICGPKIAPERWVGRISPRPFMMLNAEDDERLPRHAILTLWNAAREPRELSWLPGMHIKPRRTEIVQQLVDIVLTRVVGTGAVPMEASAGIMAE